MLNHKTLSLLLAFFLLIIPLSSAQGDGIMGYFFTGLKGIFGLTVQMEEPFVNLKKKVESQEKEDALNEIERYYKEAKFHNGAILNIARLIPEADYNIKLITKTAYLASVFSYHTGVLIDIAKMASESDHECEVLSDIAELAVFKKGESQKVVELARSALKAQSEEEKEYVRMEIEKLKTTADYASIQLALKDIEDSWSHKQVDRSYKQVEKRESFAALKAKLQEKEDALNEIESYYKEAEFHGGAILDIANLILKADYNTKLITKTAYLASVFPYNTGVLVDIAKIASRSDHECEELYDIAELAVTKLSESAKVVQLAESAIEAQSEEEKNHIRKEIEELKTSADYESIEEALEGQVAREQQKTIAIPEGVDAEKLKQRARDFLQALVEKDFEKAYAVARTRYEWVEQSDVYSNVVRIISVGEPFRKEGHYASGKGVHIPFEVELADGNIRRAFINIRWDNPEGEWRFDGGL